MGPLIRKWTLLRRKSHYIRKWVSLKWKILFLKCGIPLYRSQMFPLWRPFSKVIVFSENDYRFLSFSWRCKMKMQRKVWGFNENDMKTYSCRRGLRLLSFTQRYPQLFSFMLPLVSDCYQEFNCNPKMCVTLFKLKTIDSILIRTPLMPSTKTRAPQPTARSREFYWNLNSTFSIREISNNISGGNSQTTKAMMKLSMAQHMIGLHFMHEDHRCGGMWARISPLSHWSLWTQFRNSRFHVWQWPSWTTCRQLTITDKPFKQMFGFLLKMDCSA